MPAQYEGEENVTSNSAGSGVTNKERLRIHLTNSGLAWALLAAWEQAEPARRQAVMLAAIHDFYKPLTLAADDDASAAR
jgi:hypothetical protein